MAFVALAVLLVVVARGASPRRELLVALAGVAVVLVTGALPFDVAGDTLDELAPTLGFLVAVFVITEVAREAGLFRAAGGLVDRLAHSPRQLVVAVVFAVVATTRGWRAVAVLDRLEPPLAPV